MRRGVLLVAILCGCWASARAEESIRQKFADIMAVATEAESECGLTGESRPR